MKRYFAAIGLVFTIFNLNAQNAEIIVNDTVSHFVGDYPILVHKDENKILFIRIKSNDSTYLWKKYFVDKLIESYQCDLQGAKHGSAYFLDTISQNISYQFNDKGTTMNSYSLNFNLDTIQIDRKINDSTMHSMEIKENKKITWETNLNGIYNGYYKITSLTTNKILKKSQYLAIKESEIINKEKFKMLLEKYKRPYMFRGKDRETEIPVGIWYIYDEEGNITQTIEYEWEGTVKTLE